jgi:hypothetical protein
MLLVVEGNHAYHFALSSATNFVKESVSINIFWFLKIWWLSSWNQLLRSVYCTIHTPQKRTSKTKDADKDFIFNETEADLNKFDKIIDRLEPGSLRLPVIIKKSHQTKRKVGSFNVQMLFNKYRWQLDVHTIADIRGKHDETVMEEFRN